jgi:hypothetical protein
MVMHPTERKDTPMTAFTPTTDYLGRTVMLCDDALSVSLLSFASRQGCREIPDVAFGYSQDYAPGTVIHTLCLELHSAMAAANLGYVGWLYAASAWDHDTQRSRRGFVEDRAQGRVVCNMPTFGYVPDPAVATVRFQG